MEQKISSEGKKVINLLVDAHVFDGFHQGSRTFLKGLYDNFDTEKYNVKIFFAANDLDNLKQEFKGKAGIEFVKLKFTNKYMRLAYEIPYLIKKLNIDFAHFNYFLPLILNRNCKYIVTIHDVLFIDFPQFFSRTYYLKNKWLFGRAAKKSDLLNTVSEYSRQRIIENFNIRNKNIKVLPNAIEDDFFLSKNKNEDRLFIQNKYGMSNFLLYVSRLEPRKNHIALLKVYDQLKLWEKGIELVFLGKKAMTDKNLELYFEHVSKESKNKIHHLEVVDWNDLKRFYNAALISCYPSLCEGFGIPPLESAALKTPTICSNQTAMREFSFFEKNHIDPHNIEKIKDSILQILNDIESPILENQLEEVKRTIKKKYDWRISADILGESIKAEILKG